jgi:hypothetical protein
VTDRPAVTGAALLLAAGLLLAPATAGAQAVVGGRIEELQGKSSDVVVARPGSPAPATLLFLPLLVGDTVLVRHPAAWAKLRLQGEQTVVVCATVGPGCEMAAPYVVPKPPSGRYWFTGLGRAFAEWLTMRHDETANAVIETAVRGDGEDDPPRLAVLEGGCTVAASGGRFALGWSGGQPPFRLVVAGRGAARPVLSLEVSTRAVDTAVALPPGDYVISVRDARGRPAAGRAKLEPSATTTAPDPAAELDAAARLAAGRPCGHWEAYRRAIALAPALPPTGLLADALRRGETVPAP